jgi:hypothetical protein
MLILRRMAIVAAMAFALASPANAQRQINLTPFPVLIANGTSLSAEVDLGANVLVGIAMPAAWTAASLTFQVSPDGGVTWLELQSISAVISYTVAAGQFIAVDPAALRGFNALKVRSGTSGTPVAQGADRTLTLIGKAL